MLAVGTQLGPYQIRAPLGSGGMGQVYRAQDIRLGREVAVKVLPEHLAKDADALARFEREAKAVASLSHPSILVLHDFGTEQGVAFAVTELLEGETLGQHLTRAALPWRKALEMGAALADGLATAHAKGVIHRDLKPDNVFLTVDGLVKILDFGLARMENTALHEVETITRLPGQTDPGTIMGTVGYMSPEQVRGQTVDARSDIFSLGCVLYEMLTGKRAFERETGAETMTAILHDEPPDLADSGKKIPPDVERVIRHCLEKNLEARFQSARDLAFALRALLSDSGISTAPAIEPPKKKGRRRSKAIDSLAVLPLVNAGGDPNTEYLCDGLTESIINTLSQLPKLRVMARSTMFRYKGKDADAQEVGTALKVRAVLTGRVLPRGDRLVIAAELVDVTDGAQLWGEQYNRRAADIFAVQEEISREISDKLRLRLSVEDKKCLTRRYTENAEAYQLYLKGRYHWNKRTEEGLKKGAEFFQEAIDKDPGYALAYAGLADCYNMLGGYGILPPKETYPKAETAAKKALQIDDTLAEAHNSLAWVKYEYGWDWLSAEKEFRRAIELNTDYATAHLWYAHCLMMMGRFEETLAELRRGQELDPLSLVGSVNFGFRLHCMRQYDQAIEHYGKTLELDPNFFLAHRCLGEAYLQKGQYDEAIAAFQKGLTLSGDAPEALAALGNAYAVAGKRAEAQQVFEDLLQRAKQVYVSAFDLGLVPIGLGDKEQAFAWLEKAYQERACYLAYIKVEPRLDSLRSDPRFADLQRRIGLPG